MVSKTLKSLKKCGAPLRELLFSIKIVQTIGNEKRGKNKFFWGKNKFFWGKNKFFWGKIIFFWGKK